MKHFTSKGFLAAILITGLILPVQGYTQSVESEPTVRVVIELASASADVPDTDWNEAIKAVRTVSNRAPRRYATHDGVKTAGDLRRWRVIEVEADQAQALISELRSNPAVEQANVEKIYQAAMLPNDPQFSSQYGLAGSSGLADIKATTAWDTTTGSAATVIAIIDGGIDISHEDLAGKIWRNSDEIGGNGIDDDANGYVDDVNGWNFWRNNPNPDVINHATHIAGIAAASSNNGVGVTGVDWQARIMPVQALSASGTGGEENIIQAINYAVANGADVINMSIVGSSSSALLAAVENAYASGVVVVAAAGNNGRDTGTLNPYPACAELNGVNMVIGVGATDDAGEPANFSAYGKCVDVSAPGDRVYSTKQGNKYGTMTGTSMSAPFVAGAAGLYLSRHPSAVPAEVISGIVDSADAFSGSNAASWNTKYKGKLNLAALVGPSDSPSQPPAPNEPASSSGDSGGGDSGGGGGDSGGVGGGGGGGGEEQPEPTPKPKVAGVSAKANLSLLAKVNAAFRAIFGRNPNTSENNYWAGRIKRGEKTTLVALQGAMAWQKARGLSASVGARVLGVSTGGSLISRINFLHRQAYGRNPSFSEHSYWLGRVTSGDKKTEASLVGAMLFHRLAGIKH